MATGRPGNSDHVSKLGNGDKWMPVPAGTPGVAAGHSYQVLHHTMTMLTLGEIASRMPVFATNLPGSQLLRFLLAEKASRLCFSGKIPALDCYGKTYERVITLP
jgi:hypothetical protein